MFGRNRKAPEAPAASLISVCGGLGTFVLVLGIANAKAQDAEPRSYSNTPVGLDFLIAGHVYSQGKMAFDPDLSIADAKFHSNTELHTDPVKRSAPGPSWTLASCMGGSMKALSRSTDAAASSSRASGSGQPSARRRRYCATLT